MRWMVVGLIMVTVLIIGGCGVIDLSPAAEEHVEEMIPEELSDEQEEEVITEEAEDIGETEEGQEIQE